MAAEKRFENQVKRWLMSQGIYDAGTADDKQTTPIHGVYMKIWGGGFQKGGIPDMVLCVNGFFVTCELKSDSGYASDLQKKNIRMINASNGIGIILKPDGFEDFKKIVKELINCDTHTQWLTSLKNARSNLNCRILTD